MSNKSVEQIVILLKHDPNALCITERWVNNLFADRKFVPPAFDIFRKDFGSRGGCIAILVKNGTECIPMSPVEGIKCLFCETAFVNFVFIVCLDQERNILLLLMINYLCMSTKSKKVRLIIAGDFNLPSIDWTDMCEGSGKVADGRTASFAHIKAFSKVLRLPGPECFCHAAVVSAAGLLGERTTGALCREPPGVRARRALAAQGARLCLQPHQHG